MRRAHRVCIPGPSCLHSAFSCLHSVLSCLRSAPHLESRLNRGFQKGKTPSTFLLPYFYHHKPVDKTAEGKGHPCGVPPRLSARLPLPGKGRAARGFSFGLDFPGISVFCTSSACLTVLHGACAWPGPGFALQGSALLQSSPVRCSPSAALRMRLPGWPLLPALSGACPKQHRHAPEVQIKSKPIWYGKRMGRAGFLRAVPFFQRQKEKS